MPLPAFSVSKFCDILRSRKDKGSLLDPLALIMEIELKCD